MKQEAAGWWDPDDPEAQAPGSSGPPAAPESFPFANAPSAADDPLTQLWQGVDASQGRHLDAVAELRGRRRQDPEPPRRRRRWRRR